MSRAWAFALLCLVSAAQPALAESRSVVYSIWDVLGSTVHLRVMMRTGEARRLVGPGLPAPTIEVVKDYVIGHVAVTAGGTACPPVDQGEEAGLINTLSLTPGLYRFEMIFQCAKPDGIVLQNTVLHDLVPDHVDFARVQINGGGFVLRLFREGYESISASTAGLVFGDSGVLQYVSMGLAHVLRNLDRLSFVLGLMLMVRMRRDYGLILAGLSLGYALSIAVSLSGIIEPRMDLVDALIGLMSALVAAQIVAAISGRPEIVAIVCRRQPPHRGGRCPGVRDVVEAAAVGGRRFRRLLPAHLRPAGRSRRSSGFCRRRCSRCWTVPAFPPMSPSWTCQGGSLRRRWWDSISGQSSQTAS